jgi:hypothetical protein
MGGGGLKKTVCPGWPQTTILPISVFQVARIIGLFHYNFMGFVFVFELRALHLLGDALPFEPCPNPTILNYLMVVISKVQFSL